MDSCSLVHESCDSEAPVVVDAAQLAVEVRSFVEIAEAAVDAVAAPSGSPARADHSCSID